MSDTDETREAAQRWERVQALFHAAADRTGPERDAWLRDACGDDATLYERVLALLAADADTAGHALLEGGLAAAAEGVLGGADASLPRQAFGPYRITGVLGEGGMGVVYRAFRADLGSEAAIKLLRDASLSPARRERFAFEQRALAQLNHPSIARLYDANTLADGTPWFAMELVEGVPLTQFCDARALPVAARLALFREVCEGVRHAHAQLILHRDLKPSNILVRGDGKVKLLDFGISKSIETLEEPADATRTGLRLMTPAYAAPEQVRGGPLGVHTDVYSLGVVLYELLAGRLPFDLTGRTPSEAATVLTEQVVRRPSLAAATSPGTRRASAAQWRDLDVLCLTAMHRDPERRYRTVDALMRDLDRYLADEPLEARGDSLRYRAGKFVRRHAAAVTAASLAFVVLVAIVTFYTLRLAAARDRAEAETARKQLIQGVMTRLLQGNDDEAGPSDTLRVVTLIGRGADEARLLSHEPALQAELERTLGGLEQGLGRLDRADTLLANALTHTLGAPRPDEADVVRSLLALSLLRAEEARYDDAERLARQALERAKRRLAPAQPLLAEAYATLGRVLGVRGANEASLPVLEEALRLYAKAGPLTADGALALTDLANTHFYLGHYAVSDSLNRLGLAMDRARFGPRHPNVADDLMNLGSIDRQLGRYAEAEREYREALAITRAWYGENHPKTASCLTDLSRALIFLDRQEEAAGLLPEALAIQERVYGGAHPFVAGTLSAMGDLALDRDRYDEAAHDYGRALDIYRGAYGAHHSAVGIATANLGSVYMRSGDNRRAEGCFRDALRAYEGALSPGHVDVGIAHIKLGRVLLRQKRYAEAERESLAGYRNLAAQADPGISFLRAARKDLAETYEALGRPADAARFRAELADTSKGG